LKLLANPSAGHDKQPVSFELPPGPSTNITSVRRPTQNNVPIRVVVTPENGRFQQLQRDIDISLATRPPPTFTVTLPSGTISTIHAWTR